MPEHDGSESRRILQSIYETLLRIQAEQSEMNLCLQRLAKAAPGFFEMGLGGMLMWVLWQIVKFAALVVAIALGIALTRL
jgi:hypothetical protein